jgi:ADP-ribose pyrophosphatase YjhB (NUDIX family)
LRQWRYAITLKAIRCFFLKRNNPPLVWFLPGGKSRHGENLKAAIAREVFEETGLVMEHFFAVDTWQQKNLEGEGIWTISVTYLCRTFTREVVLSAEHSAFAWVPIAEFDGFQRCVGEFDLQTAALYIARLRDHI